MVWVFGGVWLLFDISIVCLIVYANVLNLVKDSMISDLYVSLLLF